MPKSHTAKAIRLVLLALFMLGQAGGAAFVSANPAREAAEASTVAGASHTSTTSASNKIVFVRPQPGTGGDSNIWIMDADGSNQTQLTTYSGEDRLPALSPDGSKIAYMSVHGSQLQLWAMNSDGTNPAQIPFSGNVQIPVWSPDGNRLAVQADGGQFWEVWVMNPDGSGAQRLTNFSEAAGSPSWSPDGTKLVFLSEPSANYHNLYTINSDGTGQTTIANASASGFSNHRPAWSPDGTKIATIHYAAGSTGSYSLWLMNPDGSGGAALVQNIDSPDRNRLSWSKDGNWLVFGKDGQVWRVKRDGTQLTQIINNSGWEPDTGAATMNPGPRGDAIVFVRPQPGSGGDSNIWIMDADGTNQTQLTTFAGEDRLPEISPDGSKITYMSVHNGQQQLWVMNSDGTNGLTLPISGNTQSPSWSPDGSLISYSNDSVDFWEVWVISVDGTNARRLTSHPGAAGRQAWSPDGQKLVYAVEPAPRYFDLYTVSISGTNQALLVSSSSGYSHHLPAWAPDSAQIATVRSPAGSTGPYDLWLMDADGTNGRTLASNLEQGGINNVAWSKDGQWLFFGKEGQVWRVKRDGTQLTQIINNGGWEPSVAPGANPAPNPCVADIMLVVDRSTSMNDGGKFAAAKAAVTTFISITTAPPNQVGLAAFASSASLPQGLTTDKALVITATNALTTASGTRIDLGLLVARQELAGPRHAPDHKKVIVLLSDGQQYPAGNDPVLAEAAQAKAEGATIFTIGLGADADAALLRQIASQPSYYYFAPSGADLNAIYTQISTVLACTDIGGQVFLDQNYDGVYTAGADAPLANATVNLNGAVVSQTLSSSAANGNFLFADIPPATYTVSLAMASVPAGYIATTPTTRTVGLSSAADDLDNDFGVALDPDASCLAGPLVYNNNFNGAASLDTWSTTLTDTTPTSRTFLGQFGNQTASLFVGGLPQHTSLTICFDLFIIRSWDGNTDIDPLNGGDVGPDVWTLGLWGGPTLLQTTFTNWPYQRQAYPGAYPLGDNAPRTGARENNSLGYTYNNDPMSAVYRLQVTFPHSTSVAVFDFAAAGLQSLADESWGIDNVQVKATYTPVTHITYLPVAMKHWATGIVGRVSQNGIAANGVPLELRYFNGAAWSTRGSTTTFGEGLYAFGNAPSLLPGEKYYVRFRNDSQTPGRLWIWGTPEITTYTAGSRRELAAFDIADIVLTAPPNATPVWLPYTFQWAPRPATPTDSYEFNLFDPSGNPYFYTNPPLGYVGYYTLNSLPPDFTTNKWYLWDVWVYSPDGGYGISYDARRTGFFNAGYGYSEGLNLFDWPAAPRAPNRVNRLER
jgi:Tol biopolymer transport system component